MRKKGLLFNIVLEINQIIIQNGSLILISHVNEQLTDVTQHPHFKKYLSKIAVFYALYKQGRNVDEIIQLLEPQTQEALRFNANLNAMEAQKKF